MSSVTIRTFQNLIDPAIQKYFFDEYGKVDEKLKLVAKVDTQDVYNHKEMTLTGLGAMVAVGEGENAPEDAPLEQYATTYTPSKYMATIPISYETKVFERMDLVAKTPREAGAAAARKAESIIASVYNNAFDTSYTSYGDGKPLCSTIHPRVDGGTAQSNASASGITLTEANLETGIVAGESLLSDRGNVIGLFYDTVMVPLALRKEAFEIIKSEKRSGTADNDLNAYNSSIMKAEGGTIPNIIVWKYLSTYAGGLDTRWFLMDSANHQVKYFWADPTKVEMDDSVGFKNDMMYWKVRFMASTGWSDYRGIWGSKGDGSAYSS